LNELKINRANNPNVRNYRSKRRHYNAVKLFIQVLRTSSKEIRYANLIRSNEEKDFKDFLGFRRRLRHYLFAISNVSDIFLFLKKRGKRRAFDKGTLKSNFSRSFVLGIVFQLQTCYTGDGTVLRDQRAELIRRII